MENIKAILIGVTKYNEFIADDLPFCNNDLKLMFDALLSVGVKASNIIILGNDGSSVGKHRFTEYINKFVTSLSAEDVAIVYFSGHAQTIKNIHHLCLSDSIIETKQFVNFFSGMSCKTTIILLDCCFCKIDNITNTSFTSLESFYKKLKRGTVIATSSAPHQKSFYIPQIGVSTFTYFVASEIKNSAKTVSLYKVLTNAITCTNLYNENISKCAQSPRLYFNIEGDIILGNTKECFSPKKYLRIKEDKSFIIHSITPRHTFSLKQYAVKVVLNSFASQKKLIDITYTLAKKLKRANIYTTEQQKNRWKYKTTNQIYIFFYLNKDEAENCNHIFFTIWFDSLDKANSYFESHNILGGNKNIYFETNKYYSLFRELQSSSCLPDNEYVSFAKESMLEIINIGEVIINNYSMLINRIISSDAYKLELQKYNKKISILYQKLRDLKPSDKYKEFDNLCVELISILYDLICISSVNNNADILHLTKGKIVKYKDILNGIETILL